jgi:sensor histidine kinase YesM
MNVSFVGPQLSHGCLELVVVLLIMGTVYLNYHVIYPRFFKENKTKYWLSTIALPIVPVMVEMPLLQDYFVTIYLQTGEYIIPAFFYLFVRDMVFVLGSLYFNHSKALKINQEKEIAQLEKELAWERERHEIESEYMRYKIAPHFLYNIINYIFFCSIEKKEELPNLLYKLSCVLDYYMHDSTKPLVKMADEYAFYEKYIELERLRYENGIEVSLEIDHSLDDSLIAPLLFECYIGNAFKYAPHDGTGKIEIKFEKLEQDKVQFTCKNNKQKSTKRHDLVSSKNGINFNRKRLDFLYNVANQLIINEFDDHYFVKLVVRRTRQLSINNELITAN